MAKSTGFRQLFKEMLPKAILDFFRLIRIRLTRLKNFRAYQEFFAGKSGIEIGGPSAFFKNQLPVYSVISALDGVNFAAETMWEGLIQAGDHFVYEPGRVGRQFIAEATDLREISTGKYQFLISSNCLEHVANPIKAVEEWLRVVVPGGWLLLVLPNKVANFDHRRPVTRFEHLLDDYQKNISEDDMTHLPEILELHDLSRDKLAGGRLNFIKQSKDNYKNRGLHHHVFDLPLIEKMLSYLGVSVLKAEVTATDFVVLGRTPG